MAGDRLAPEKEGCAIKTPQPRKGGELVAGKKRETDVNPGEEKKKNVRMEKKKVPAGWGSKKKKGRNQRKQKPRCANERKKAPW